MSAIPTTWTSETPQPNRQHRRMGLDHARFACADEADIHQWVRIMDELGIPHGPVEEPAYAVVVAGRDPDGLPFEFYWP